VKKLDCLSRKENMMYGSPGPGSPDLICCCFSLYEGLLQASSENTPNGNKGISFKTFLLANISCTVGIHGDISIYASLVRLAPTISLETRLYFSPCFTLSENPKTYHARVKSASQR
jgi:hypothetical protein